MDLPKNSSPDRLQFYKELQDNPFASASASFIASILLIIVLFVTTIQPTVKIITQLRDEIDKLGEVNTKLETKIASLKQILPAFRKLDSELDLVNAALPNNHEFPTLERQIRYLVTKNNLNITSLSLSGFPVVGDASLILENQNAALDISTTLGDQSQIMFISINLTTTGDYSVIKSFVNDFQKLLRVTTIDQLVLKGDKSSNVQNVEVSLRGNVYYLAAKETESL